MKIMKISTSFIRAAFIGGMALLAACGPSNGGDKQATESAPAANAENSSAASSADVDPAAKSESKGVGKFTSVEIGAIDNAMADKGKGVFTAKCSACHQITDQKVVGPGLKGVTKRRTPEWIMNQITNPVEMEQKDPVGKALLAKYLTQMSFQNVSDDETRQILEYLRKNDQ
ncbi:c-type cytochrome [Mucilaginibacter gossypii]|nr:cytochrome c [Mucilaginibacter gossypii]